MLFVMIGGAAALALFLFYVARRPATFHIERAIEIGALPEAAFARVNDLHAWSGWSPWEKLDPGMRRSFSGAPSGVGAIYGWLGTKKVGEGRMTIVKSEPPSFVVLKLEFLKPFVATNTTTFTFVPTEKGTKVTWAMDGTNSFMAKAMHLVMNMDKMVGGDFERGLAALKVLAEAHRQAA